MEFPTSTLDIGFYVFAGLALLFSLAVVTRRNPIASAFCLILVFFCIAAVFALLQAHFLAGIQILVYAGAVMVLFVFVIMLLNADIQKLELVRGKTFRLVTALVASVFAGLLLWIVLHGSSVATKGEFSTERIDALGGNVNVISTVLFSDYTLPFELTSILLLVGMVGSVALAKRRLN